MANLDNLEEISKVDSLGLLRSIESLPDQLGQAWTEVSQISIPDDLLSIKNVVVSGMGGSALGGRIIDSLIMDRATTPIEISTEFGLPNYVGAESLVIVCSYSGNTEETLASAQEAIAKNAKIFAITTGGKLGELCKEKALASYIFNPIHNPSNQPRMGLGYSVGAVLALLAKGKYIHVGSQEETTIVEKLRQFISDSSVRVPTSRNEAKAIALALFNKEIVLVASEHLVGAAHAFKNQINENSKTFSVLFDLPELNHHLLEGLANPRTLKPILQFLFIKSQMYSPEVLKRYPIVAAVVEKNNIATSFFECRSETKIEQIFEVLALAEYVSFYLSILYGIDPTPIVWVDYLKKELSKT